MPEKKLLTLTKCANKTYNILANKTSSFLNKFKFLRIINFPTVESRKDGSCYFIIFNAFWKEILKFRIGHSQKSWVLPIPLD